MTFKTLAHIHKLLAEEERRLANAVALASEAYTAAEKSGADNADALKDSYKGAWKSHNAANEALRDFEKKDW
ncbi:MAG: hypothetical protein E7442_03630 [Ruminococcaceae bacterium]|nr:hypothetical protein [Oscillospiraceae bacterium]